MAPPSKKLKTSSTTAAPTPIPGGDDLEDNFALEDDFNPGSPAADAISGDEGGDGSEGEYDNVDEDSRAPLSVPVEAKEGKTKVPNAKKRPADDPESIAAKKKKGAAAKEKKKGKAAEAAKEWEAKEFDDTARLPVEGVADRLSEKQRKALPEVSGLELDEMRITGASSLSSLLSLVERALTSTLQKT